MSVDFYHTHINEWRRLEIASENGRTMRFTPYRGPAIVLFIPIVLLIVYLALPVLTGSPTEYNTLTAKTMTETALQLDPACSPFGTLTPCVSMSEPSNATMSIWQPAV
jgi:hypothetical protein